MRDVISLNGTWKLKCTASYVPLRDSSMETGKPLEGLTPWLDAQVPGGVTLAMYRHGYIDHPYVDMNSLKCEWIENRWWIYRCEFDRRELAAHRRALLHFEGVDYACIVYLNGIKLGEHTGMYEDFTFDVTDQYRAQEHFVLDVLILHAPDEMGQLGRTSLSSTQKSRFNYKWDFSTRLVNLGIWQGVELILEDEAAIGDTYVRSDVAQDGRGLIHVDADVTMHQPLALQMEAVCAMNGVEVARQQLQCSGMHFAGSLQVENPELWYPNGLGAQPLYDVTLTLRSGDRVVDQRSMKQGIRHFEMLQNEDAPEGALPYTIAINGRRVYMKGVNITPMDHIYGDLAPEMVEFQLRQAAALNANIVRVWGGGLIETEHFYNLCDQLGLMVWQEFIQSSSGVDNIPSELPGFLELLRRTALHAVKVKRNHTSLVIWSGGNELTDEDRKPQTIRNRNLAMLGRIVAELDPQRFFVPTSPTGPESHIDKRPGYSHDVHGWWQYQGNGRQYIYFGDTDSMLHSEFGCDGMSCMQTVCRQLSTRPTRPERMHDNDLWRFHGDWWCTYEREMTMFGPVEDIERYIRLSQWMQAEGLRFILEANQRRKWHNSGSIIWQLSEPWPNLSCTSIVDYYGHAKHAYHWTKKAFAPLHVTLNYRHLDYAPGTVFSDDLVVMTDHGVAGDAQIRCDILGLDGTRYDQQVIHACLPEAAATHVGKLTFTMPRTADGLVLVRLQVCLNGQCETNDYYFSNHSERPYRAAAALSGASLQAVTVSRGDDSAVIRLINTGDRAVLHAYVEDASDEWNLMVEDHFRTLLPGESFDVQVRWSRRFRVGFDEFDTCATTAPVLTVCGIGLDEGVQVQ